MALVSLRLERMMIADLERERLLLDLESIDRMLELRIHDGLLGIRGGGASEFNWRPIHSSAVAMEIEIDDGLADELVLAARHIGFPVEILAAAFAVSDLSKPLEVTEIELEANRRTAPPEQRRILRTELGRGNIYDASFELPGYQLAFLRLLGGRGLTQSAILEEAFIALANQVCTTNSVAGRPLSSAALDMAARMVNIAGKRAVQAPSRFSHRGLRP